MASSSDFGAGVETGADNASIYRDDNSGANGMSGLILILALTQAALAAAVVAAARRPEPRRVRVENAGRPARR